MGAINVRTGDAGPSDCRCGYGPDLAAIHFHEPHAVANRPIDGEPFEPSRRFYLVADRSSHRDRQRTCDLVSGRYPAGKLGCLPGRR